MNQCGCNTHVHGNNTKNIPIWLSLSQTSINTMFFLLIFYAFSSTKSENKRVEQVLPVSGGWGKGGGPNNVYTCK
jgi:hypothetical protein